MRDAEPIGDLARVADVLAGAAGALLPDGGAMIVKLKGDAHDVVALLLQQGRRDRRIDAARHGDHHAGVAGRLVDIEGIAGHGGAYIGAAVTARQRCWYQLPMQLESRRNLFLVILSEAKDLMAIAANVRVGMS